MICIFCAIVARDAESSIVYEDDAVLAFMDIRPITRGHLLVIPKRHAEGLAELDPADGGAMYRAARTIGAALRTTSDVDGINLLQADGADAGQEVFHAHLHVIPRRRGDGIGLSGASPTMPPRAVLDDAAAAVRALL
ncbi:MAG: HIT family protein [Rhodococcus sp.]|nr:HIT family protein [Rhodococcus sp. (in: high G+C Gram-positive bacteria)]